MALAFPSSMRPNGSPGCGWRAPRTRPVSFQEALADFGSARAACHEIGNVHEARIACEEQASAARGGRFLIFGEATYPAALAALAD
jgi:hypothetical protein